MTIGKGSNSLSEHRKDWTSAETGRYEGALDLAEAGKYEEALARIQENLNSRPGDVEALNDKGAVLHCLGRSDEAIDCLLEARSIKNNSPEIVWNLAEAYLAAGIPAEAMKLFDDMDRMDVLNVDILNRAAAALLDQNNKGDCLDVLLRSLQIWPDQELLRPMLDVIRSRRPKIAIFGTDDRTGSLRRIVEFIEDYFETRLSDGRTGPGADKLMEWSDISWFQSCPGLAVAASKKADGCRKIVGIHSYDQQEQWPGQMNWDNIDTLLITANSIVRDLLVRSIPGLESKTSVTVVPNCVDIDRFTFIDRPRGKNIAFLSDLLPQKNPVFILQCMQKLHYIDPGYRLFFGGDFVDRTVEQYVRHMIEVMGLGNVVSFDGRQANVCSWLEDKHYVVSTSFFEDSSTELLEAMACGLKPVVHNFPGADRIFPAEFLFNISEQFCELICSCQYEPIRYRRFVEETYPLHKQLNEIKSLLNRIESDIDTNRDSTGTGNCTQIRISEEIQSAKRTRVSVPIKS